MAWAINQAKFNARLEVVWSFLLSFQKIACIYANDVNLRGVSPKVAFDAQRMKYAWRYGYSTYRTNSKGFAIGFLAMQRQMFGTKEVTVVSWRTGMNT